MRVLRTLKVMRYCAKTIVLTTVTVDFSFCTLTYVNYVAKKHVTAADMFERKLKKITCPQRFAHSHLR